MSPYSSLLFFAGAKNGKNLMLGVGGGSVAKVYLKGMVDLNAYDNSIGNLLQRLAEIVKYHTAGPAVGGGGGVHKYNGFLTNVSGK